MRAVWCSQYSDWLWATRSGDRIPIFHTCPDQPWGPPNLLYNGYWVFPGGKERLGCDADPSPPSSAVVKKEPVQSLSACTRVHFTCLNDMHHKGKQYLLSDSEEWEKYYEKSVL